MHCKAEYAARAELTGMNAGIKVVSRSLSPLCERTSCLRFGVAVVRVFQWAWLLRWQLVYLLLDFLCFDYDEFTREANFGWSS